MWCEIVGCERWMRSSISPPQRQDAGTDFDSLLLSLSTIRILRRVGSAMACRARSREISAGMPDRNIAEIDECQYELRKTRCANR